MSRVDPEVLIAIIHDLALRDTPRARLALAKILQTYGHLLPRGPN